MLEVARIRVRMQDCGDDGIGMNRKVSLIDGR